MNMTLHNGMILSTLSISSRDFALGFLKRPHTNGANTSRLDSFFLLLLESSNKVHPFCDTLVTF